MNITKPKRVTRTYTQQLVAEPSAVFPLLCPVREADWIDGWGSISVIAQSGVAERDCVFVTAAGIRTTQSGTSPVTSAITASWKC